MAFEATKREWGELYAFFRLLADGHVYAMNGAESAAEKQMLSSVQEALFLHPAKK